MKQGGWAQRHRCGAIGLRALAALLVVLAAGCSRGNAAPKGTLIKVKLQDFNLTPKVERVPAGFVTFRLYNASASTHEFIVARTDVAADALPLGANGITVNEDSRKLHAVADVGDLRLGTTRDLTLNLKAGHYVIYCNLEGHYRGGMHATVDVTA